jgi:hypothetical protein
MAAMQPIAEWLEKHLLRAAAGDRHDISDLEFCRNQRLWVDEAYNRTQQQVQEQRTPSQSAYGKFCNCVWSFLLPAARARQVVPISELVFGALTQNRSSLEDRTTTRR